MTFQNVWHLRRVAESASKACEICYKPTGSVLITPDKRDFFYVCNAHLSDRAFASPLKDEEAEKRKAAEALQRETEKLMKEFEEKKRQKEAKKKEKEKEKEKKKTKQGEDGKESTKSDEKDQEDSKMINVPDMQKPSTSESSKASVISNESARIFTLHKTFYQMRLDRLRNQEMARRNRERLKNPSAFPTVPSGDL